MESVLASEYFSRAPALTRFLTYICEQSFAGKADALKEYSIAVEALGRPASFDHTKDSIVRVEAHKLRRRLKSYYDTAGPQHGVLIQVPPGQYAPTFRDHPGNPAAPVSPPAAQAAPPPAATSPGRRLWLAAALAAAVALLIGAWPFRPASPPAFSDRALEPVYRITAGTSPQSRYVDDLGRTWTGDVFVEGGARVSSNDSLILHTDSPGMYRTRREGPFRYALPVEPGVYQLHLHFAELEHGPGNSSRPAESERVFTISINDGAHVFPAFEALSVSGEPNEPVELIVPGLSPNSDGVIAIEATATYGQPMLAGLELFHGIPGKPLPIRLLAGRTTDFLGGEDGLWSADRYFQGGRSVPRSNPIAAGGNHNIYTSERYGNFRYRIPVARGYRYTLRLHFVEQWWGGANRGGGGAGSRIFDVHCNGAKLLTGFDAFKEAGGENRALVRTFPRLQPTPQGLFDLNFIPSENYAFINAIEIVAE